MSRRRFGLAMVVEHFAFELKRGVARRLPLVLEIDAAQPGAQVLLGIVDRREAGSSHRELCRCRKCPRPSSGGRTRPRGNCALPRPRLRVPHLRDGGARPRECHLSVAPPWLRCRHRPWAREPAPRTVTPMSPSSPKNTSCGSGRSMNGVGMRVKGIQSTELEQVLPHAQIRSQRQASQKGGVDLLDFRVVIEVPGDSGIGARVGIEIAANHQLQLRGTEVELLVFRRSGSGSLWTSNRKSPTSEMSGLNRVCADTGGVVRQAAHSIRIGFASQRVSPP